MNLKDIAQGIKVAINAQTFKEYPRPYLGMSQIGHKCARNLWMYFRWANLVKYKAKNKRIFSRGDLEEPRIIGYLEQIGIKILSRQETLTACQGHLRGHIDAKLANIPGLEKETVLGEFKTMAAKYFKVLEKKDSLKEAKPEYYDQDTMYAHYVPEVNYILHYTTNKDTEDNHIEIIEYDREHAEELEGKAQDIIFSNVPPKKVSNDPTFYMCKWCDFYGPCQLDDVFMKSCRTCMYSEPIANFQWYCKQHHKMLTLQEQKDACLKYNMLKV